MIKTELSFCNSTMIREIETPRFILREIKESDLEGIFALDSNPEVHRYLGKNPVTSRDQVKAVIVKIQQQYQEFGIGRLAIIDKVTEEFIGWTGLKYEQQLRPEMAYYDVGYRIREEFWGQGIATETALASLKFGFEELKLEVINAAADIDHGASNHVLKKVGMKFKEVFQYGGEDVNWYELSIVDWK